MRNVLIKSGLALAATLCLSSGAQAYTFLKVTSGATSFNCSTLQTVADCSGDGFVGIRANGTLILPTLANLGSTWLSLGAVGLNFGGSVGDFDVSAQFKANVPGTLTSADFNETSLEVTRVRGTDEVASNLTVEAIAFGYTNPLGTAKSWGGSATLSSTNFLGNILVNTQQGLDKSNLGNFTDGAGTVVSENQKMLDTTAATGASFTALGASNNFTFADQSVTGFATASSPYSLSSVQTYTMSRLLNTVNASSTMTVRPISAPGTLALAGFALLGVALAMRQKTRA
jgi:hypothetical protein